MKRLLLSIVICAFPFMLFGKSDLTKQEKAIVKALKKEFDLEEVYVRHPYSGFMYYELLTKDFKRMIADSTGAVIIPQSKQIANAYQNRITFVPGHAKGYGSFLERGRNARTITAYYPGNEPVFVTCRNIGGGANEYAFFSVSGAVLNSFEGSINESLFAPVNISQDVMGNFGVMAMDGRILLPNEYTSVDVQADGICTLMQMQEGMEKMGGACFSDMMESAVPCNFYYVEYSQSDRCWKVQIHEFDSLVVYDERKQYDTSFLDEGQRLFEQQRYEEARKYYSLAGENAKWAKFYIGATYCVSARRLYDDMNEAMVLLESSSNKQDRYIATDIRTNMGVFRTEAEKTEKTFGEYIKGGHARYAAKAKELLYELDEMQTSIAGMESRLDMVLADYDQRCADLERREQEQYNRHLEQQQLDLERKRLQERQLAREQRERELRMRQRAEAERRQRAAKKREEERKKAQQSQQQGQQRQQTQRQQQKNQQQEQRQQSVQQPQKTLEQRSKEMKGEATTPTVPRKKAEN